MSIDLTEYWNTIAPNYKYKQLTVHLALTREDMCEALKHDFVLINNEYYETPKDQLLHNIGNCKYYGQQEYTLKQRIVKSIVEAIEEYEKK